MISFKLTHLNLFWPFATYLSVTVIGLVNFLVSYLWLVETKGVSLDGVKLDNDLHREEVKKASPEVTELLKKRSA